MTHWWRLEAGDALVAEDLCEAVRQACLDAGQGATGAYRYSRLGDGLHCRVTIYFPPAAAEVAKRFSAVPCNPPPRVGLEPLTDDPGAGG
ncbi:MAG: hypothetical protein HUJ28_10525 [Chromatiales bacterium]|nr:hypothetical protein [Chromatiales bacterium]